MSPARALLPLKGCTEIRGPSLKWIQVFLSDRTQTVVLEKETSDTQPVTSGVTQGSVQGPIYLTVFSLQDAQLLQQDLDRLHEWELQWDIEFNLSKCDVIHVTRVRTPLPSAYLLHGQILESVGSS